MFTSQRLGISWMNYYVTVFYGRILISKIFSSILFFDLCEQHDLAAAVGTKNTRQLAPYPGGFLAFLVLSFSWEINKKQFLDGELLEFLKKFQVF